MTPVNPSDFGSSDKWPTPRTAPTPQDAVIHLCVACGDILPPAHWRRRQYEAPRFVRICGKCSVEVDADVTPAARETLRQLIIVDQLPIDPPKEENSKEVIDRIARGETTGNAPEPEFVRQFREVMTSKEDGHIIQRIWIELRHAIKRAGQVGYVTWADLETLIEAAIKRARKEIKGEQLRQEVIKRLTIMRDRTREQQPIDDPPPEDPK